MLTAFRGVPLAESRQSFSQGGGRPWSRSSMIRSATASPARCREVFPSAGLPPLALGLELELALVLVLEPELVRADVVVMGCSSPSGNELSGPGRPGGVLGGTATAQRARQGSQSGNEALSGVSGRLSLQFGAIGRFYAPLGDCGNCVGKSRRRTPARALRAAMGPFPGFQGAFYSLGQLGASMPPWGIVGIAWGSPGAGRPPGLSERQWGPFRGFRAFLQFGAIGRFYAPLGRLRGCGVEEDCRVVPAGEFRGCGGGLPGCACGPGGGRGGGAARPGLRRAGVKKAFSETPGRGSPPTERSFAGRAGRPPGPGP